MPADLAVAWYDVAGRPVRVLSAGEPRAGVPEVVLVPGLGAVGYLPPTVRAWAAWTRVRLLDLPGCGNRRTARLPAGLEDVTRAAAGWLDVADRPPVVLVGHSTGAQVALGAALLRPSRVATLVLAGASFPPAARRPLPLLGRVLRTARSEQLRELRAVLPQYLRGARQLPELLAAALRDRPEERIGGVTCPVVVLRGRDDRLSDPGWAAALAGAARDGRVVVVPGAHNFPFAHPKPAARALRDVARSARSGHGGTGARA